MPAMPHLADNCELSWRVVIALPGTIRTAKDPDDDDGYQPRSGTPAASRAQVEIAPVAAALLLFMAGVLIATSFIDGRGVLDRAHPRHRGSGCRWRPRGLIRDHHYFRRPLGLPIPHTAILPRGRSRIGEGLGIFLERYFLTEELVTARLRASNLAEHAATWLGDHRNAEILADRVVAVFRISRSP